MSTIVLLVMLLYIVSPGGCVPWPFRRHPRVVGMYGSAK